MGNYPASAATRGAWGYTTHLAKKQVVLRLEPALFQTLKDLALRDNVSIQFKAAQLLEKGLSDVTLVRSPAQKEG